MEYCYLTHWNQWPTSWYFHQAHWWEKILWTLKWTKHHWFLKYGLGCCTSDLLLVIHDWYAFYVKNPIYACFMFLVISSHICVLIFKTCPFMTYICTLLALSQNPLIIDFSDSFWTFWNCQGSLNRTCPVFWPKHIRVSGFWLYKGGVYYNILYYGNLNQVT
jgi:hypothetical protein